MFVAVIEAEIHIPAANSLKAKRKVVHSLRDRISSRYRASVAEVGQNDLWQRATLGIASVHRENRAARRRIEQLREIFDQLPEASLTRWDADIWS